MSHQCESSHAGWCHCETELEKILKQDPVPQRRQQPQEVSFVQEALRQLADAMDDTKFFHFALCDINTGEIINRGGATICVIGRTEYGVGVSICSPLDQFNRRDGRGRAFKRAALDYSLWILRENPVGIKVPGINVSELNQYASLQTYRSTEDPLRVFANNVLENAAGYLRKQTTVKWIHNYIFVPRRNRKESIDNG